jgi:hypothetical protein
MVMGVQIAKKPEDEVVPLCSDEDRKAMKRFDSAGYAKPETRMSMASLARRLQLRPSGLEMGYSFGDSVGILHLSSSQTERALRQRSAIHPMGDLKRIGLHIHGERHQMRG